MAQGVQTCATLKFCKTIVNCPSQSMFSGVHIHYDIGICIVINCTRALCRIQFLPVTHVLVDTRMLTIKLVYKLTNVPDDLKWATNTHDTIYTHFQDTTNNIYGFGRPFFAPSFFPPSTHISARPYSFLPVLMTGGRVST